MMARLLSLVLVALLSAGAWANPCVTGGRPFPLDEGSGIGGTGLQPGKTDGSGIGGTGHRDGSGSGSGGTGRQAGTGGEGSGVGGTGVVGEITGFGSICVNGLEIHYDAETPVSMDGQSSGADRLAVGQVVAVHAQGQGGDLRARHIQVRHALVGRVEAVNRNGQLRVLGQWVSPPLMSRVQPGNRIKVSGYRADSRHVVASRIDPAQVGEPDLLTGEVEGTQRGVAIVSGVRVRLPAGADSPRVGEEVRVNGRSEAGGMRAERIGPDGLRGFLDKVDRLSVKDRVRPTREPGKMRVGAMEFNLDARTRVQGGNARDLQPGRLVRVEARQKEGRVIIERIEVRDEIGRSHEKSGVETRQTQRGVVRAGESGSEDDPEGAVERAREAQTRQTPGQPEGGAERTPERDVRSEGAERTEKGEKAEKLEKVEKAEKAEKVEKVEKPEKLEKVEKFEKPELEKPEKIEKPELEKPERPEKVEMPERPEKPERVERLEKPEKPEKIERPELPERDD